MIDKLSIAVHAFTRRMLISLSVDEILLPRFVNWLKVGSKWRWLCFICSHRDQCLLLLALGYTVGDSIGAGVFARSTDYLRSLRLSLTQLDIVCFLPFFSVKPFTFIRFIDVWSMKYWQKTNICGACVYSKTMLKKSVLPLFSCFCKASSLW